MESHHISQGIWRQKSSRLFTLLSAHLKYHFQEGYGWATIVTLLAVFWIVLIGATWAEARDSSSENSDRSDEEYNFNWLDPEKKIYVLQNRKYIKTGHPLLSVIGGVGFSNPYRTTYNIDPRVAYYVNETWGIELFYTMTNNNPNNTVKALSIASPNALPQIREIRSQYGAMIHYVPWYAKINVFNTILYFDWYFGAGAGTVQTYVNTSTKSTDSANFVQQDKFGLFFSTGHQFHVTRHLVFRMDLTGSFYQTPINGLTGETSWYSNYNFGLGLGWRI